VLLGECKVTPEKLASIMNMVDAGTINGSAAKKIFELVAHTGHDPKELVKEQGLEQIGSVDELEKIVQEVIAQNPTQVEQYKQTRNERMFGFFVGKAMQKTQGKGNPAVFTELFLKLIQ
jgi:aspartyl-tRNA(Asn)/glutamyl-tRNA(Gln) amidotransferase subunit B